MSNLAKLKTNHYKSKLINTKKFKFNNNKYISDTSRSTSSERYDAWP